MPNLDTLVMEYYCNIEAQTAVQALKKLTLLQVMQDQSCHVCKMYHLHITLVACCCFFMSVLL